MKWNKTAHVFAGITVRLCIILIICTAFATSFSWFSRVREVQHNQMQIGLDMDNAVAEYRIVKYDTSLTAGTEYVVERDEDNKPCEKKDTPLTITTIDLNQYDTVFVRRNRYTPAFIQIKLTQTGVTPPDSGSIHIHLTRTENTNPAKSDMNFISHAARFTAILDDQYKTIDDATYLNYSAADLYTYVDTILYNTVDGYQCSNGDVCAHDDGDEYTDSEGTTQNYTDASKTFFTDFSVTTGADNKNVYTVTKSTAIDLKLSYEKTDWKASTDDEGGDANVLFLYLYISYDRGLIDYYKDVNNLAVISLGQNFIDFENDLKDITISFGSN